MMDVHPPEHGIHGVRDFFIHLLTITAGLLIALGLENAAEAAHHRHLRREAEASLRRELSENRHSLESSRKQLQAEREGMLKLVAFLQDRAQNKPAALGQIKAARFEEDELPDAAWTTAASTGVLSYMEYDEAQRFASAYREQALLQNLEQLALQDFLGLMSCIPADGGPDKISPASAAEALPYARKALGHLTGIYLVGEGTIKTYDDALKP